MNAVACVEFLPHALNLIMLAILTFRVALIWQSNYFRRVELNFNWNSARLRIKFKRIAYLRLFKVLVIKIV